MVLERINDPMLVKDHGVTLIQRTRLTSLAFADDINILGRSCFSAQHLVNIFEECLIWTRCLVAEPNKFGCLGYCRHELEMVVFNPNIYYSDKLISFMNQDNQVRFRLLGRQYSISLEPLFL